MLSIRTMSAFNRIRSVHLPMGAISVQIRLKSRRPIKVIPSVFQEETKNAVPEFYQQGPKSMTDKAAVMNPQRHSHPVVSEGGFETNLDSSAHETSSFGHSSHEKFLREQGLPKIIRINPWDKTNKHLKYVIPMLETSLFGFKQVLFQTTATTIFP